MSLIETKDNGFQSKDGKWYLSYEEMAEANRKANNEYLRSKGLLNFKSPLQKRKQSAKTTKTRSRHQLSRVVTPPLRRSSRVRRSPPENSGLEHDFQEAPRPKRQRKVSKGSFRSKVEVFTEEDFKALEDVPDWLDDMEEWLLTVPHGPGHKVVSEDNAKQVMRQVQKMVSGIGVTYHHWDGGTYFKRGVRINLKVNFSSLYDEAVEMEHIHGKDLGNGWLLRHPIRKLQLYQEYRLLKKKK